MSVSIDNPKYWIIPRSLSTGIMMENNHFRNKPGILNKVVAQGIYPIITTISLIETAVASIFTILSLLTLPFTTKCFKHCFEELKSSSFAILWSIFNFIVNPFCRQVAEYEMHVRSIASRLFYL